MKEFLILICKNIEYMRMGQLEELNNGMEPLKQQYGTLDEQGQWDSLGVLAENTKQNGDFQIFLFSYLLCALRDEKVEYFIENSLLEGNIELLDRLNTLRQLWKALFSFPIVTDEVLHYQIQDIIYTEIVAQVREQLNVNIPYVPFEQRNQKRVVLMIEPIRVVEHAPTAKLVNIYHWLEQLGYEVFVYATNMRNLEVERCSKWYRPLIDRCSFGQTAELCQDFLGIQVKGYNLNYTDEHYFEELKQAKLRIAEYNPAFILTIGDANILADMCGDFTTVCAMACVNCPAHTVQPVIVRYFRCTKEENERYLRCIRPEQRIFEMIHVDELIASAGTTQSRKDYGIEEDQYVILIAGNRLDFEVSKEVQQMFQRILEQNDVLFVFIGNCPKLEKELKESKKAQHYRFLGAVQDFKGVMNLGNLFLNPPRQGGGTGAFYAVESDVPVLTLPDCDVAQVGDAFVCEKLWDMPEIVDRYIHDKTFAQQQKECCRKSAAALYGVDNIGNIERFCCELQEYILETEERAQDE